MDIFYPTRLNQVNYELENADFSLNSKIPIDGNQNFCNIYRKTIFNLESAKCISNETPTGKKFYFLSKY